MMLCVPKVPIDFPCLPCEGGISPTLNKSAELNQLYNIIKLFSTAKYINIRPESLLTNKIGYSIIYKE